MKIKKIKNINLEKYDQIHFWQLKLNKIYFKLTNRYYTMFYDRVFSYFKTSFKVGNFLLTFSEKYNLSTNSKNLARNFRGWKSSGWIIGWAMYELNKKVGISIDKLEKNIRSYRLITGAEIFNPKLPIIVNPEFDSLLVHMVCDGTDKVKTGLRVGRYAKFDSNLMKLFQIKFKNVFGEVKGVIEPRYKNKIVLIPSLTMDILKGYYNIKDLGTSFNFPSSFIWKKKLSKLAIFFTFLIDEGTIEDKIEIRILNRNILESLRKLMTSIGYKIHPIRKSLYGGVPVYVFQVANEHAEKLLKDYRELVEVYPSCKLGYKEENLDFIVKRNKHDWTHRFSPEVKQIILKALKQKPKTVKELSRLLMLSHNNTRKHLNRLSKENLIRIISKKKLSNLWGLFNE